MPPGFAWPMYRNYLIGRTDRLNPTLVAPAAAVGCDPLDHLAAKAGELP
jgi:hypothetical protein